MCANGLPFTYCLEIDFRLAGKFSVRHFLYHVEFYAWFPLECESVRTTMFSATFDNSIIIIIIMNEYD